MQEENFIPNRLLVLVVGVRICLMHVYLNTLPLTGACYLQLESLHTADHSNICKGGLLSLKMVRLLNVIPRANLARKENHIMDITMSKPIPKSENSLSLNDYSGH